MVRHLLVACLLGLYVGGCRGENPSVSGDASINPADDPSPGANPIDNPTLRLGSSRCGPEDQGTRIEELGSDGWTDSGLCMLTSERGYESLNLLAGYGAPNWDYSQANAPASGLYGWSYYIRAFDLIRDTPVKEIGWGQWSKPAVPTDAIRVCGVHPHGFTCDDEPPDLSGALQSCGAQDWQSMESCNFWCCGEDDKCGVRGSIEGGMGYWMYTLETPQVKWMAPGSTNANYEIFGGTFLNDRPQPCTALGGAVRIANNLLMPNDFLSFEGKSIDGFLGYMLSRSPIGKRSQSDNANYWTIAIDTANFSGPVMYMSAWFWDSRINWHPHSLSWSDPRALVGYVAEGFEGRVGAIRIIDSEGVEWRKTNRWAFPKDRSSAGTELSSTLFTGHSQYNTDWASTAVEGVLSGATSNAGNRIVDQAMQLRRPPGGGCNVADSTSTLRIELEDPDREDELLWHGFGVTGADRDEDRAMVESVEASCHVRLNLDESKLDCTTTEGWCEGTPYLELTTSNRTRSVMPNQVSPKIRAALDLRAFEPTRRNDGRYLGPPAASESVCFDTPGPAPADPRLYCTRTQNGNWIGYKWYRFVDQPELNQVFASMPLTERAAAKCFMQERIERLHASQARGLEYSQWFEAPQGESALPSGKVRVDPALLVTAPPGLELGFVPISLYERKRQMPDGCEVIVGANQSEPDPLPESYYEGFVWDAGWYDREVCPANTESGGVFNYPGIVFPYSASSDQTARMPYAVPTREHVADVLEPAQRCGLPSDPPLVRY